ncbi:non-ribosomal peptide synthetase, partial [Streptomyces zagrosensis]
EAPIRTHLIRLAPDEHYLVISQHHIASDAWSHNIFIKELNTLYRPLADLEPTMALTPTLEPLPLQYADFAYWESRQESRAAVDKDLIYWRERLDGTQTLALPTDFPHTSSPDERAGVIEFSIPEGLVAELDRLSQERQASVFMLLLAAYQVLLSRYSGQDDIAVGVPVANRNRAETENLIGFFVNTLVLRSDLSGDQSFTDLLAQVREHALDAYEHQDLPFERLVEELQPERDLSRTPLFQTMFQLDHGEIADWSLDGLSTEELTFRPQGTKFDLILDATRREGGLACQFTYRSNLFEAATVERLGEHYRVVLQEIADNVSVSLNELDIRTPRERAAAAGTHGIPVPVAVPTVPERLAEMAANIPDQPAVTHGDACLTYGQLHEQSSRLARRLVAHGVGLESPVAVFLERGTDHLVAALAVMKAGGVYVPVDPQIPSEQAAFIVDDVDARVVLVHNATAANVAGDGDGRNILSVSTAETDNTEIAGAELFSSAPDNAAYVIYTSGSTGHPKGVVIEHRSLANLVDSLQEAHRLAVGEPTLHKTSTMFDVHIQEMLWPLAVGAHVVVADHGREGDVRYLADLMRRHGVTTAGFVPSLLRTFVDDDRAGDLPALRRIFSAGEVLTRDLARRVIDRYGCELYNLYGPAETTVYVTMGRILHDDVVTIGKPLDQVRLYVVDRTGRPAPTGAPGELLVAGVQVGRGYVNRPELTAERFVDNPVSGAPAGKAYRTGDAARYLPDGRIEFLGRLDEQMKIRGHRVEPEEIESAVDSFAGVAESAVVIKEHAPGDNRLHAYVVLEPGRTSASPQPLREYLASRLVQSLVPNFFNVVESLPRTISGKIDRNRLRSRIEVAYDTGQQMSGAPRTLEEWLVASAFGEVLDRPQPGPDANFFDLGGHSLLAAALVVKIHAASGVDVPLAEIFRRPTVAGLADLLAGGQEGQRKVDSSVLVPLDVRASGKPIFCVHPVGGGIFCYADLARRLTRSRPVLGLQAHGLDPAQEPDRSIEDMAARYLREIDSAGYEGPYTLLGWSFGGAVAFEMARQLGAAAGEVDLVLLDSLPPGCPHASDEDIAVAFVEDLASMHSLTDVPAPASGSVFDAFERAREHGLVPESLRLGSFARRVEVYGANLRAAAAYRPSPAQVETTLYRPSHSARSLDEGWSFLTAGRLSAREITGDHYEILRDPNLGQWTENLLVKE